MIPIITFHAIDDSSAPMFTPTSVFEAQLCSLAETGYKTLPLTTVVDILNAGEILPKDTVVLTFDDGYESVYREAWPRLKEYGFTGTIFLVTGHCDRDNQWSSQPTSAPVRQLMTWAQVEEMAAAGWSFGAHTHTHPLLPLLTPAQVKHEMVVSQHEIVTHIGQSTTVFAYPYGAATPQVKEIARHHFCAAVSTHLGLVTPNSDPYFLERIDAYYLTPHWIKQMNRRPFHHYLKLRQWIRTIRRRWHPDWKAH